MYMDTDSVARSTDISVLYEFMESRGNQRSWVEDFLHGLQRVTVNGKNRNGGGNGNGNGNGKGSSNEQA